MRVITRIPYKHLNYQLLLFLRLLGGRIARDYVMEEFYRLLQELAQSDLSAQPSPSCRSSMILILQTRLQNEPWFPQNGSAWIQRSIESAADSGLNQLKQLIERDFSEKELDWRLRAFESNLTDKFFFTPEAVHLIYASKPEALEAFVNEGVDRHCRFIRRAVSSVIYRNRAGIGRLSLNGAELEDELWGNVTEEIVRCLTDTSARIWRTLEDSPLEFPPKTIRGRRQGSILRIALSMKGRKMAMARSDSALMVWDIESLERIHTWDLQHLRSGKESEEAFLNTSRLFFSEDGSKLALETGKGLIVVFSLNDTESGIKTYTDKEKKKFLRECGNLYIPDPSESDANRFDFQSRRGDRLRFEEYREAVYDWSCDADCHMVATASECERLMPQWMRDAGFERSVFHIAKKRLIDLIRKHTHTAYHCWRCGSASANSSETRCRECDADFSLCPLGCKLKKHEILNAANRWQCPRCGTQSRLMETAKDIHEDYLLTDRSPQQRSWAEQHDMERILNALSSVSVTYKKREIACDRLVEFKTSGMTNEEIGEELGIPRGSVDYVWNQCREQVLKIFKDL